MADDNRQGGDKEPSSNNWMKSLLIWAGILLGLVLFVQIMGGSATRATDSIPYSDFLNRIEEGSVKQVVIAGITPVQFNIIGFPILQEKSADARIPASIRVRIPSPVRKRDPGMHPFRNASATSLHANC